MESKEIYKTRLRTKGQVTVPSEVRKLLNASEGDDIIFRVSEEGQVFIERAITIPADQAWFWSERWQRMEQEAQADIESGKLTRYADVDGALTGLEKLKDAADNPD
jgi:AbrB family looped-hinge helix DNA binding protein